MKEMGKNIDDLFSIYDAGKLDLERLINKIVEELEWDGDELCSISFAISLKKVNKYVYIHLNNNLRKIL